MSRPLTLASLFDGSGGFPLAGLFCGIEPLWASEVEPFPIRVTTKRLPQMRHFGDINRINGATVPSADVITAGFCCQDLSISGKRAGLHGARSCLFFQIIRIVREMRAATRNKSPRFIVLENVVGLYSSAAGGDFLEVLNELVKIKDKTLSVPMPEKSKWQGAGEIVGDNFSACWRTFDSQFWGVAQRRRRCYIVVDLDGERAGKILFDETRLRGNPPQGGFARETAAGDIAVSFGSAVAFEPGACSRLGGHFWQDEPVGTLRADMGDNQTAVVYDARGNGDGKVANTMTGDHNGHVSDYTALAIEPVAYSISSHMSHAMISPNATAGIRETQISRTLDTGGGDPRANQGGIAVVDTVSGPKYTVRRLMPSECALLQGFPADYCAGLETQEPTEDDISFWSEVFETRRHIIGKSSRPKSRNQIIKWLRSPNSDTAEYSMWGNGISLPVAIFVLGGIAYYGGGNRVESAGPRTGSGARNVGSLRGKD